MFVQFSQSNIKSRKRKRSDLDEIDSIYGIVTTGEHWLFTLYTTNGLIASTSLDILTLNLVTENVNESELVENITKLYSIIKAMLIEQIQLNNEIDGGNIKPNEKRRRMIERIK